MTPQFSNEEIERMRAILNAHDAATAGNGMKEFDLNNPPKEPYSHKEFPLHLTNKDGKVKIAHNAEQAERFRRKGYLDPHDYRAHVATLPKDDDDDDADIDQFDGLDEADAAEAAAIDEQLGIGSGKKSRKK